MNSHQFDRTRDPLANEPLVISDNERELLRYAPPYATMPAALAVHKARELQQQGVLRNGLYYLVLIDLVGSTEFMARHGNPRGDVRIETFITKAIEALSGAPLRNVSVFIKDIGDAALLCFSHFPDILVWRSHLSRELQRSADDIQFRTCVHVGEVYLNGLNPLALAVSQLFRMEKSIAGGDVGLTEPAFRAAWPSVMYPEFTFLPAGSIELQGYPDEVPLVTVDLEFLKDEETLGPARERAALEAEGGQSQTRHDPGTD